MPTTIVVDGATITFGDTSGDLAGRAHGADQQLGAGEYFVEVVGDANALLGRAIGGADTVTGQADVVGDAFTLSGHARGGGDVLSASGPFGIAYGDAKTMTGSALGGNDLIRLSASFSRAVGYGDAGTLTNWAHGGNDTLSGTGGDVHSSFVMFGDAQAMSRHATGGDDLLIGPAVASSTVQYGDAQTLSGHVQAGNDTLSGPSFNYLPGSPSGDMYGDGQNISGHVHCGNDSLSAVSNSATVRMYGDGQTLSGDVQCGNDTLSGAPAFPYAGDFGIATTMYGDGESLLGRARGGNDVLISHSGVDIMWGDAAAVGPLATTGADRFVFSPINGHDQIMDFQPGKDRIELDGFGFASFQDLTAHLQATPDGVLISFDANDDILIRGVTPSQLTAGDFVFA